MDDGSWMMDHGYWIPDVGCWTLANEQTTIRLLGGLLSAHHLAEIHPNPTIQKDAAMFLEKATDLGDRLLSAFDTPSGVPLSNVNLKERRGVPDMGNNGLASLAEAASLQLELKYLSQVTGDWVYWKAAEKVRWMAGSGDLLTKAGDSKHSDAWFV